MKTKITMLLVCLGSNKLMKWMRVGASALKTFCQDESLIYELGASTPESPFAPRTDKMMSSKSHPRKS